MSRTGPAPALEGLQSRRRKLTKQLECVPCVVVSQLEQIAVVWLISRTFISQDQWLKEGSSVLWFKAQYRLYDPESWTCCNCTCTASNCSEIMGKLLSIPSPRFDNLSKILWVILKLFKFHFSINPSRERFLFKTFFYLSVYLQKSQPLPPCRHTHTHDTECKQIAFTRFKKNTHF